MIRAKIAGQKSLAARLKRLRAAQRAKLKAAVAESLNEVRERARANIRAGARSGTGALAESVEARSDADGLGGTVGTALPHGRYLEFGTRQMAARPWLQPAFDAAKPKIRKRLRAAVRAANRSVARGGGVDT